MSMQSRLAKAVKIIEQQYIPVIPDEILLLKEELSLEFPNTVTIANIISKNCELLGDFLTLVNSNVTAEKNEINDAKAAVNILGTDDLYNIFLASSLTHHIAQSPQEKEILLHGSMAGLAAAELSYWTQNVTRSEAYMAGLMQNIGSIYMCRLNPEVYIERFRAQLNNPNTAYIKECDTYETAHTHVGIIIAKKWNIDPNIYKAILLHHEMDIATKITSDTKLMNLIHLINLANYVVLSCADNHFINHELKDLRDLCIKRLGLPEQAIKSASAAVNKWGKSISSPIGH